MWLGEASLTSKTLGYFPTFLPHVPQDERPTTAETILVDDETTTTRKKTSKDDDDEGVHLKAKKDSICLVNNFYTRKL